MLDFVQVVSDHLGRGVGLDEDSLHWVSVAIRESVINAIKHGNRNDADQARVRRVRDARPTADAPELVDPRARSGRRLRSRDGGQPARPREPAEVERPRHLPHPQLHGRRAAAARARGRDGNPHGRSACSRPRRRFGTRPECRPTRSSSPPPSRRSSAPATCRWRSFGRDFRDRQEGHDRSRHRGRPRGRAHVPRAHRGALSRSSDPGRGDGRRGGRARRAVLGVRSDRRHDELRARPADLLRVARARDRRRRGGRARSTIRTARSCSPPSAAAARS